MNKDKKPAEGDSFKCEECGMQILVTEDCECESCAPFFSCCEKQMQPAGKKAQ